MPDLRDLLLRKISHYIAVDVEKQGENSRFYNLIQNIKNAVEQTETFKELRATAFYKIDTDILQQSCVMIAAMDKPVSLDTLFDRQILNAHGAEYERRLDSLINQITIKNFQFDENGKLKWFNSDPSSLDINVETHRLSTGSGSTATTRESSMSDTQGQSSKEIGAPTPMFVPVEYEQDGETVQEYLLFSNRSAGLEVRGTVLRRILEQAYQQSLENPEIGEKSLRDLIAASPIAKKQKIAGEMSAIDRTFVDELSDLTIELDEPLVLGQEDITAIKQALQESLRETAMDDNDFIAALSSIQSGALYSSDDTQRLVRNSYLFDDLYQREKAYDLLREYTRFVTSSPQNFFTEEQKNNFNDPIHTLIVAHIWQISQQKPNLDLEAFQSFLPVLVENPSFNPIEQLEHQQHLADFNAFLEKPSDSLRVSDPEAIFKTLEFYANNQVSDLEQTLKDLYLFVKNNQQLGLEAQKNDLFELNNPQKEHLFEMLKQYTIEDIILNDKKEVDFYYATEDELPALCIRVRRGEHIETIPFSARDNNNGEIRGQKIIDILNEALRSKEPSCSLHDAISESSALVKSINMTLLNMFYIFPSIVHVRSQLEAIPGDVIFSDGSREYLSQLLSGLVQEDLGQSTRLNHFLKYVVQNHADTERLPQMMLTIYEYEQQMKNIHSDRQDDEKDDKELTPDISQAMQYIIYHQLLSSHVDQEFARQSLQSFLASTPEEKASISAKKAELDTLIAHLNNFERPEPLDQNKQQYADHCCMRDIVELVHAYEQQSDRRYSQEEKNEFVEYASYYNLVSPDMPDLVRKGMLSVLIGPDCQEKDDLKFRLYVDRMIINQLEKFLYQLPTNSKTQKIFSESRQKFIAHRDLNQLYSTIKDIDIPKENFFQRFINAIARVLGAAPTDAKIQREMLKDILQKESKVSHVQWPPAPPRGLESMVSASSLQRSLKRN